jgi:hypothetical protein
MPQATHRKIVFEASKHLVGEFLFYNDSDFRLHLLLEEFEPVFLLLQGVEIPPPPKQGYHFQIFT